MYLFRQHFSSTIKILKWNLRLPRFALFNWLFWIYVLASQTPAKHHPGRYIQWSGEAVDWMGANKTNRFQGNKLVVCLTCCIASIHRNNHRDGLVIENKIKKRCTWGAAETRAKLAWQSKKPGWKSASGWWEMTVKLISPCFWQGPSVTSREATELELDIAQSRLLSWALCWWMP